jgi:tetratricopeptide (TPR) repeat protein
VDDRLRPLWDFDDLGLSGEQFKAQVEIEESNAGRAEVMTQIARIAGLRGDFESGDALLDEAGELAADDEVARARIDLERGPLRRSSGDPEAALPLFESAFASALDARQHFIAADAAHMAALAAPGRNGFVAWTRRGIDLAKTRKAPGTGSAPCSTTSAGSTSRLVTWSSRSTPFERALAARLTNPENSSAIALAGYGVGKTTRMLGRADDAIPVLEQAVA